MSVCIGGKHIAHLVQSNKLMYKLMKFYFLNWVQFSCDFGKVVPSGITQGKVCHGAFIIGVPQRNHKNIEDVFLCTKKKIQRKIK